MSVKNQLRLLLGGLSGRRSGQPTSTAHSATREFLDRSRFIAVLIFVFTVAAIVLISSAGLSTLSVPVLPNQVATMRVTASASFTYPSDERTRIAREQLIDRVPPVYRLDFEPWRNFETAARDLLAQLEILDNTRPSGRTSIFNSAPSSDPRVPLAALNGIVDAFNARGGYHVSVEDIATIYGAGDAKARAALFDNGFAALRDIATEGVHDDALRNAGPDNITVFQIARPDGAVTQRPVQSLEDALTFLRVTLVTEGQPRAVTSALFRLFRNGVTANLIFDRDATHQREQLAVSQLKPVMGSVVRGQTIIEPGQRVSPEQYEMFLAHRQYLLEHTDTQLDENLTLFGRILLVLAMVVASVIYIRLEDRETLQSNVRLCLLALVVIVNLALVRLVYSLGGADFFIRDGSWASTLPYVAPTALAPLIVAILIDAGSAIFMALLISIFTGLIYGNRLDLIILTFLASLVAIFGCREVHKRGRVVRAALTGGLTLALYALPVGFADSVPVATLLRQMAAALATGLLTGMAVVGILPVLESLFKRTTDITLLELTDYNHPLLRRMQLEAPGTYHHSLIVAQLAENAASAIGANPLLARTCALFHDIGKTANPTCFTENQRDRANPHDQLAPAESARIIKQHVSDGVDLALRHNLPRSVIDVIRQHHGTTLVRYFYQRAVELSRAPFAPRPDPLAPAVDESAFRYDGPKPQFKESAIIALADGVEAATRSLRQTSAEQLGELIDRIVHDRVEAGELDESPLTFVELARVKHSFQHTLLNMLHGRVAYPSTDLTPSVAKG
ncbi:MAG: HDIG domain-containing protein [Verrucomicrobia bacterium]|nr:HDIG domain-containing protein [Verrucomicrobiota bacterium]